MPGTGHRTLSQKRLAEIRKEELDRIILQELVNQEAKKFEIIAEPEEIEMEMKQVTGRFTSGREFEKALTQRGLVLSDIQREVEHHIIVQKMMNQEVYGKVAFTDETLVDYYKANQAQFRIPEQIRLRLILVSVDPSGLDVDWEEGYKQAMMLADGAREGADFALLAEKFSHDEETKDKGGDTGLLHQGRLPFKELESVAFSHKVGEVSDPIRTLYGLVVFKVEEKNPGRQLSFDQLNKDLLRREMTDAAVKRRLTEWIDDLKAQAKIEIY